MKGVAVVSGGMDSVSLLYAYRDSIAEVLHFNYGSKHNDRERACVLHNCDMLSKPCRIIELGFIRDLFTSDLLRSGGDIPEGHYADPSMRRTVVPFRNGIMLAVAAGYAESVGCSELYIGNHFGDHAIYPDCRESFITPMAAAIQQGTYAEVKLQSPFMNLTKRDVALIGREANVPFEFTYTCYKGGANHCGVCGSCTERKEALEGFDPTRYEA